jgi:hypothetical protein|tara:strand:+ start:167 stop:469 length:303 start_codon:yes stop_codon:yes gene_type:complete
MASIPTKTTDIGEPTWDIAYLFPNQGYWSEDAYLDLKTNHLIELVDGKLEVLPMPPSRINSFWRFCMANCFALFPKGSQVCSCSHHSKSNYETIKSVNRI